MSTLKPHDIYWMRHALELSKRGLGRVNPNPAVGCVIVREGHVVGRGWTQPGGRPHAETEALKQAGVRAAGATAYVSLEPCSHTGKTSPCAHALIEAAVSRVVIATEDPDPRVSGRGARKLRDAGIELVSGVLQDEAAEIHAGFFSKVQNQRPYVALKLATSLDGRIATASGESKWITGPTARRYGHLLRALYDGILVGVNTVLADDPMLTCRLPGLEDRSPIRIILDRQLRTPVSAKLVQSAGETPTWIVCDKTMMTSGAAKQLAEHTVKLIATSEKNTIGSVLKALSAEGLTRLLVEGGGTIHAAFVQAGYCDKLYHISAGKLLGGEGVPVINSFPLALLGEAPHFNLQEYRKVGDDLLATYAKAE